MFEEKEGGSREGGEGGGGGPQKTLGGGGGVSGKKLNYCICLIRMVDRLSQPVPIQRHLPALPSNCFFIPLSGGGRGGRGN